MRVISTRDIFDKIAINVSIPQKVINASKNLSSK